jgi:Holliday junction resolvase RusA-like endonuclease
MQVTLTMPLPNWDLSSNKKHGRDWRATQKIKKQDIAIGTYTALSQLKGFTFSKDDKLSCELIFYQGDNYHRDWLNLCASYKAMEDGIFIALNCDDSQIKYVHVIKSYDKHNPRLIVKLTKIEGDN